MRRRLVPVLLTLVALAGCSTSTESLHHQASAQAGVIRVKVEEAGGDDDLPFTRLPHSITVLMDSDASTQQVQGLWDTFEDDIDDGAVESVEVVLDGKRATLATGEGIQVTPAMVRDLVAAQHDVEVVSFRREAYPVLPSIHARVATNSLAGVTAFADRYADEHGLDWVEVSSEDFSLDRDAVNDAARVTRARERLAARIDARFGLRGAAIDGRGPLRLTVAPEDLQAARRVVAANSRSGVVRRVVVRSSPSA